MDKTHTKIVGVFTASSSKGELIETQWRLDGGGSVVVDAALAMTVPEDRSAVGGYYVLSGDGTETWSELAV